jgi:hypothetical protein
MRQRSKIIAQRLRNRKGHTSVCNFSTLMAKTAILGALRVVLS